MTPQILYGATRVPPTPESARLVVGARARRAAPKTTACRFLGTWVALLDASCRFGQLHVALGVPAAHAFADARSVCVCARVLVLRAGDLPSHLPSHPRRVGASVVLRCGGERKLLVGVRRRSSVECRR